MSRPTGAELVRETEAIRFWLRACGIPAVDLDDTTCDVIAAAWESIDRGLFDPYPRRSRALRSARGFTASPGVERARTTSARSAVTRCLSKSPRVARRPPRARSWPGMSWSCSPRSPRGDARCSWPSPPASGSRRSPPRWAPTSPRHGAGSDKGALTCWPSCAAKPPKRGRPTLLPPSPEEPRPEPPAARSGTSPPRPEGSRQRGGRRAPPRSTCGSTGPFPAHPSWSWRAARIPGGDPRGRAPGRSLPGIGLISLILA